MIPIFNISNPIIGSIDKKDINMYNINNINNDNSNDNYTFIDIYKYLQHSNYQRYKKIFKKKTYKKKKLDEKHSSIFTLDIFSDSFNIPQNRYYFFCLTCKLYFNSYRSHNFIMFNKCPNILKQNNFFVLETIYENHYYEIKYETKPDLYVEMKIVENNKKDKHFYITNLLFIKCPICLTFQPNCIIQKCGHCLCKGCLNSFLKNSSDSFNNKLTCWICRKTLDENNKILFKL